MDRFKPWLETMYFYCSSELYDLDRLKSYIAGNPGQREFIGTVQNSGVNPIW